MRSSNKCFGGSLFSLIGGAIFFYYKYSGEESFYGNLVSFMDIMVPSATFFSIFFIVGLFSRSVEDENLKLEEKEAVKKKERRRRKTRKATKERKGSVIRRHYGHEKGF